MSGPADPAAGPGAAGGGLDPQLELYARDLRRLLDAESRRRAELEATNRQLQAFARDVRAAYERERRKSAELEQAHLDTLWRLLRASQYRDEETGAHIARLSHYSKALALALGRGEDEAQLLFDAAPMHDLGKIGVPDAVLQKPGPLDADEWQQMKRHPAIGASLLKGGGSKLLETARIVALTHHERWDGGGYPRGLAGDATPLAGRIVMLVDQYDALRSARRYKPAFSHDRTCGILLEGDGRTLPSHFDPRLLDAFRELQGEFDAIYERIRD